MHGSVLITGSKGTIGKYLTPFLDSLGFSVFIWDREKVSNENYAEMEQFIYSIKPSVLIHLAAITSFDPHLRNQSWKVNYEWTSELAWICKIKGIKFIFTSSDLVFDSKKSGPFNQNSIPNAVEGYGFEKRMAEERIFYQNPEAVVLRLGWQIAEEGNNSMTTWLDNESNNKGFIQASEKWYPSCSFIEDTIQVFLKSFHFESGIYMVNANKSLNFFQIVHLLRQRYNKSWEILSGTNPTIDQRMFDDRIEIPELV